MDVALGDMEQWWHFQCRGMVGVDDLREFFQPRQLWDSMISLSLHNWNVLCTAQFPEFIHTWILRDFYTYLSTTTSYKSVLAPKKGAASLIYLNLSAGQSFVRL